jgi:SPP1 gp7 family putative phage head morphogenesis protein
MSAPYVNLGFLGKNETAQKAAEKNAATLVTAIGNETRLALRALVARAIRDGIAPVDAARLIRSMVGMNTRQAMAAMNYRASLVEIGHTPAKVEALLDRYVQKKIRERATMIARTETLSSLNRGMVANWKDAQAKGLLGPNAMKEWMATSEGACPECEALDGTTVPLDDEFEDGDPPLHPHCSCALALVPGGKKSA